MNYTITAGDTVETRSDKAKATARADELRNELKVGATVATAKGTVVYEVAAPRTIKMSPRFTRIVELPEGVEVPKGMVARYVRKRAAGTGLVVLHDVEGESDKPYALMTLTGKVRKQRFETTRAAGKAMDDLHAAFKKRQAEKAEGGEQDAPAPTPAPEKESVDA